MSILSKSILSNKSRLDGLDLARFLALIGMVVTSGKAQNINAVMLTSLVFCLAAMLYAWGWSKAFKRGPLESLMRMLTG